MKTKRSMVDKVIDLLTTTAVAAKKSAGPEQEQLCLRIEHLPGLLKMRSKADALKRSEDFKPYVSGVQVNPDGVSPGDVHSFMMDYLENASLLIEASREANQPIMCISEPDLKTVLHFQSVTDLKKYLEKNGKHIPEDVASLQEVDREYEELLAGFKVGRRTRVAIARRKQWVVESAHN